MNKFPREQMLSAVGTLECAPTDEDVFEIMGLMETLGIIDKEQPNKIKVSPAAFDQLQLLADDGLSAEGDIEQLENILSLQGYYSGVRYRYTPVTDDDGNVTDWQVTERSFG